MLRKSLHFLLITSLLAFLVLVLLVVWRVGAGTREGGTYEAGGVRLPASEGLLTGKFADPLSEDVVRAFIYVMDSEKKSYVDRVYLCVFDRKVKNLRLYEIPGETVFEISEVLYRGLSASDVAFPEVVRVSSIYRYHKSEEGLYAGLLMLNEHLGTNVGHYLRVVGALSGQIFENGGFAPSFEEMLLSGKGMSDFVEENFKGAHTDVKKKALKKLLKECKGLDAEEISFTRLPGEMTNRGYFVDVDAARTVMMAR